MLTDNILLTNKIVGGMLSHGDPLPLDVIRSPESAAALLDPTRQQLLAHLKDPDSASGLARRLRLPRQRINYHLKVLETAGLVEMVEERRKGNCLERVVRATARAFIISPEALGRAGPHGRDRGRPAERRLPDRRGGPDDPGRRGPGDRARKEGKRVATLTLETDVRFANADSRAKFAEELANAVARLAAKYHDDKAPGGRRFRLLAAVHPVPVPRTKE